MTFPLELQFVDLNALVSFCTPATQQRKARTIHIVLQWKRDGDKRSPLAVAVDACQSSTWIHHPSKNLYIGFFISLHLPKIDQNLITARHWDQYITLH